METASITLYTSYLGSLKRYGALIALGVAIACLPFSVKICHLGIILFLTLWLVEGKWREKLEVIKHSTLVQIFIAFSILQLLGILYTEDVHGTSILEKKVFFFLLPIALATTSLKLNAKELTGLFWLFVFTCFVGSIMCLINASHQASLLSFGVSPTVNFDYFNSSNFKSFNPDASDRWLLFSYIALAEGINIHPAYFAIYVSFCIVFLMIQTINCTSKLFRLTIAVLILYFSMFIIFLSVRIALVSLLVILIFTIGNLFMKREARAKVLFLSALTIILLTLFYVNPVSRYRAGQEIITTSLDIHPNKLYKTSTEIRASLWWLAVKSFSKINPIWGAGTGDVESVMKETSKENNVSNILASYDPHNQYLNIVIGNGFIGLILFVSLLAITFHIAWLKRDYLCIACIFLFSSLCFTESALELQKGITFFALFFSLLVFHNSAYQVKIQNLRLKL